MPRLLTILLLCLPFHAFAQEDSASIKAVILAYHRIDEPEHTESSLSFEQFAEHVAEIKRGGYHVMALPELVVAFKKAKTLPEKTIAITFEGGYQSIQKNAVPLLIENDLPFTIFIASESTKIPNHLSWKDLQKIGKYKGASFGILPAQYKHISDLEQQEITRLINQSRSAFKENMGIEATLFSYPYGEISSTLKEISKNQGFKAAFGLHSGPADAQSDIHALPRFSMTENYADIERFQMITDTYPIPVTEQEPSHWKISEPLRQIGFTVQKDLESDLGNLSCHISGQAKPQIEILERRVEIIPETPITAERTRLNCTLPVEGTAKQWRWLGMLFH